MAEMDNTNALRSVDEEYIRGIFIELETMELQLDPNPLQYGPRRLNGKTAQCRNTLTRCEQIFLQVSHDLHWYRREHRLAEADFNLQLQDMLANDPETRAGRNLRDREAIATMKLRDDRSRINMLSNAIQDLESVVTVLKAKRGDLRDIQGRLRDQIRLCQDEIGLGARWGSQLPPEEDPVDLEHSPKLSEVDLHVMQTLVGVDGEINLLNDESNESVCRDDILEDVVPDRTGPTEGDHKPVPEMHATASAAEVDEFLTQMEPIAMAVPEKSISGDLPEDFDLDSLLDTFK